MILADAFEAIIGAIYLDQGFTVAETFVAKIFFHKIDDVIEKRSISRREESLPRTRAREKGITPAYETLSGSGYDHDKRFTVGVFIGSSEIAVALVKVNKKPNNPPPLQDLTRWW